MNIKENKELSEETNNDKDNNKKKILIKLIIIITVIVGAISLFVNKNKDSETELNESNNKEEINIKENGTEIERDIFYFYGIAYEIYMQAQEGFTESEIKSNLIDLGYLEDDINSIFNELNINWETKEITNTKSKYYIQMLEDGIILNEGIEITPITSDNDKTITTGFTIKNKSNNTNNELPNISIE